MANGAGWIRANTARVALAVVGIACLLLAVGPLSDHHTLAGATVSVGVGLLAAAVLESLFKLGPRGARFRLFRAVRRRAHEAGLSNDDMLVAFGHALALGEDSSGRAVDVDAVARQAVDDVKTRGVKRG